MDSFSPSLSDRWRHIKSIYPDLSANKGWRQTAQKKQEETMLKSLQLFAKSSFDRGRASGQEAGNGIEVECDDGWREPFGKCSCARKGFGSLQAEQRAQKDRKQKQFGHSSSNWWDAGSDGGNSDASAKGKNGGMKKPSSFIKWESEDTWGVVDSIGRDADESFGKKFGPGFGRDVGNDRFGLLQAEQRALKDRKQQEQFGHSSSNLTSKWDNANAKGKNGGKKKQSSSKWASSEWDTGSDGGTQQQAMSKNVQLFANSPFGPPFEVECHDGYGDGLMFAVVVDKKRDGTEKCVYNYFETSELTRIGIDTVKKELANGIVPKVPKAEKYEISKVQPIDNCFSGFQAEQRAQRDRQEEKDRQAFNWASEDTWRSVDSIGPDAAKSFGNPGFGRDVGNGKFGLLQADCEQRRAQKKSWEEFLHSSSNLASGPWEGIIGGKKKHSSFNLASAWDAGSDGGSINGSAKGKNGGKKKQSSFNWESSLNAGDSDGGSDGGSSKASAKGKNWWELDYCAPSTAGDSDGGSDDGSNSDSNASANSKNGGKKKKADGNVNVHIYGCCIFI